jgi:L-phenylalanine/L-methionine N-acetyltransferase
LALGDSYAGITPNTLALNTETLLVTEDNERAIRLYRSFGFEVEGKKKYSVIKDGKYADLLMMARYTLPSQIK